MCIKKFLLGMSTGVRISERSHHVNISKMEKKGIILCRKYFHTITRRDKHDVFKDQRFLDEKNTTKGDNCCRYILF